MPTYKRPGQNAPVPLRNDGRLEDPNLEKEVSRLHMRIAGQDNAIRELARQYAILKSGMCFNERMPVYSIMLAGPSGVGKTESVLALVEMLLEENHSSNIAASSASDKLLRIDCGEYQDSHEVAKLIGAPPGYLGHRETVGVFDQSAISKKKIMFHDRNGYAEEVLFILVDEAEKAHIKVHNMFLGILDYGVLHMGSGTETSFGGSVIFFTTNLGNWDLERNYSGFVDTSPATSEGSFSKAYRGHFPPEYRGRIKKTITYGHLSQEDINEIIDLQLRGIEKEMHAKQNKVTLEIADEARVALFESCNTKSEGARGVIKKIESDVRERIILASAAGSISGKYEINVAGNGDLALYKRAGMAAGAY